MSTRTGSPSTNDGIALANPGHGCIWLLDARGVLRSHRQLRRPSVTNPPRPADLNRLATDPTPASARGARPVRGHRRRWQI
jgi:hypothetical protein